AGDLPAHVPTLELALSCCEADGVGVNVEIKALPGEADEDTAPTLADAVTELLVRRVAGRAHGEVVDEMLVTRFDPRTLDRVRSTAGDALPTGWLLLGTDDPSGTVAAAAGAGRTCITPWDATTGTELIELAHRAGLAVNVWTVDDPIRLVELAQLGADG